MIRSLLYEKRRLAMFIELVVHVRKEFAKIKLESLLS